MKSSKITRARWIIRRIIDALFIMVAIGIDVEHFMHHEIIKGMIMILLTIAYIILVVRQIIQHFKQERYMEEENNDNG